jgi:hypothetical protein
MKTSARTMRLAGVDIGTLTCRLLIADLPPGGRLANPGKPIWCGLAPPRICATQFGSALDAAGLR